MLATSANVPGGASPLGDTSLLLGRVFHTINEGVVFQDDKGVIVDCNQAAERILGLTLDQMKGRTSMDSRWRAVREDGSPFLGEDHPAMITLQTGESCTGVIMGLHRPERKPTWILINSHPINSHSDPRPKAVFTTFTEVSDFRRLQLQKERLADELYSALARATDGILPICANCKSIRDDHNSWVRLEEFLAAQTGVNLSHTICPTCFPELYPELVSPSPTDETPEE